jgi:hypothetical protein
MDQLWERIGIDRRLIADGFRPLYHVMTTFDGSAVDIRVHELPIIHLFVPDSAAALDGARALIARTLAVPPSAFDVTIDT